MKIAKAYSGLKKELNQIEANLHNTINTENDVLKQSTKRLLHAGGKRIRPVFVLLSSKLGNADCENDVIKSATAIELIHMATLVHDDVIDYASLRRGKPTISKQYDNRVAMYSGDYLLACALELVTSIRNNKLHKLLADTIVEVCVGEIEQIKEKFDWNQNVRTYLRRIRRKTAILIACCCKIGAILGGLTDREAHTLYKYGYYIGMSYQIIDDILDFLSTEKQLGKPVGNDLLQGNITYPVLLAMQDLSFRDELIDIFYRANNAKEISLENQLQQMHELNVFKQSYELSDKYLQKALKEIEKLPKTKAQRILLDIANYIGQRRS